MEKLVELLNEYEEYKSFRYGEYEFVFDDHIRTKHGDELLNTTIISKSYGFIERLVENDKINVDEINCQKIPYYTYLDEKGYVSFKSFGFYEQLLMLLAISDTPIEDLISYLKE